MMNIIINNYGVQNINYMGGNTLDEKLETMKFLNDQYQLINPMKTLGAPYALSNEKPYEANQQLIQTPLETYERSRGILNANNYKA
jgi:hypothetical protein